VLTGVLCAASLTLGPATLAAAAGHGYAPGPPAPGGTVPGLPGQVTTVTTVGTGGGQATGTIGSTSVAVNVGPSCFADPVQIVLTSPPGQAVSNRHGRVDAVFGVGVYENGSKLTGSFCPVLVTVTSANIVAGSSVWFVVNGTMVQVPSAQVTNGSASFYVSSDPEVAVTTVESSTAPISSATVAVTGEPFLLEELVSAFLVCLGISLLVALRLRRRTA
jgi:hypothetical protein